MNHTHRRRNHGARFVSVHGSFGGTRTVQTQTDRNVRLTRDGFLTYRADTNGPKLSAYPRRVTATLSPFPAQHLIRHNSLLPNCLKLQALYPNSLYPDTLFPRRSSFLIPITLTPYNVCAVYLHSSFLTNIYQILIFRIPYSIISRYPHS